MVQSYVGQRAWVAWLIAACLVMAGLIAPPRAEAVEITNFFGFVWAADTMTPLEGIEMTLSRTSDGTTWEPAGGTVTNSGGNLYYDTTPGVYKVGFRDPSGTYAPQYWDGAATFEAAQMVTAPASWTTTVVATMELAGHIKGTVTTTMGAPVAGARVTAYTEVGGEWTECSFTITETDGTYDVAGLGTGIYRIGYGQNGVAPFPYAPEFFNDVASVDMATDVAVLAGAAVSGFDAVLASSGGVVGGTAGSISGTVIDDMTLAPIQGISVTAMRWGIDSMSGEPGWVWDKSTWSDVDGTFLLEDMEPGMYRLRYSPDGGQGYLVEYGGSSDTLEGAADIVLSDGQQVTGADAELKLAGRISGTVAMGGSPVEGIWAEACKWDEFHQEWRTVSNGMGGCAAYTGADGTYSIGGLETGVYRVFFHDADGDYAMRFLGDTTQIALSPDVPVVVSQTTPVQAVELAPAAHIAGTLTGIDGPLSLAYVSIVQTNGDLFRFEPSVSCNPDGTYNIGGLATGSYRVRFNSNNGYDGEVYDDIVANAQEDIDSGALVAATEGATTSGIDAVLGDHQEVTYPTQITGTVTSHLGQPVEGAQVVMESRFEVPGGYDWSYDGGAVTGPDGAYVIDINYATPGAGEVLSDVHLRFEDPSGSYLTEWYSDDLDRESSDAVSITVGQENGPFDAQLQPAGHIAGTVTSSLGSADGVGVTAYALDPAGEEWQEVRQVRSATDGTYDLGGLPSGTYRVGFGRYQSEPFGYVGEAYSDVADIIDALDVAVTAGSTTAGIDAELELGGAITGTVTGGSGGLSDVYLEAYSFHEGAQEWRCVGWGFTDGAGFYSIDGLRTGAHRVGVINEMTGDYAKEWYDDASGVLDAADVAVTAGSTTSGIDMQLAVGGSLSGTVLDQGAQPAEDLRVIARRWSSTANDWVYAGGATTDFDGAYQIRALSSGNYRVEFLNWEDNYVREYYEDQTDISYAEDVAVVAGSETSGIDAQVERTAHILGRVTGSGAPLDDFRVTAWTWSTAESRWVIAQGAWTYVLGNGEYRVSGLRQGSHRLVFEDNTRAFAQGYYDGATDLGDATGVAVLAGEVISGIDIDLQPAAHINGTVRDGMGDPVGGVDAIAYRWDSGLGDWDQVSSAMTGPDGAYSIAGLPAGSYRVGFGDFEGVWGPEFYGDIPQGDFDSVIGSSTPVVLATGATTGGIDVELGAPSGVNVEPVVNGDYYFATEDQALTVSVPGVLDNDSDDGPMWSSVVADPAHGTLMMGADGGFIYTPEVQFSGTDMFSYQVSDGSHLSAPVAVTIDVLPVNDAPLGTADTYSAVGTLTVPAPGVLGNDTDAEDDVLASVLATGPVHGNVDLQSDGSFVYASGGYVGTDKFWYFASDGAAFSAPVCVTINASSPSASDTIAPHTTISGVGAGWSNTDVTAILSATDAGSGIARTDYSTGGAFEVYTGPLTISAEGTTTVRYRSTDGMGNVEATKTAIVRVDKGLPATPGVPVASSITNTGFRLTWAASHDAVSGLAGYDVIVNGGSPTRVTATTLTLDHLAAGTAFDVEVVAVDVAGNQSDSALVQVNTPSSGADVIPVTDTGADVTVLLPDGGRLVFDQLDGTGAVHVTPVEPRSEPSDENFRIVHGAYYDIHVEADFTGWVTITLPYDETQLSGWQSGNAQQRESIERSLKLKHRKASGGWEDVTTSVDTNANTITGRTTSFSDFWIEEPVGSGNWVNIGASANLTPAGWAVVVMIGVGGMALTRRRRCAA